VTFGRVRYQCIDHNVFELPYGDAFTQSAQRTVKRQSVHNPFDVPEALRLAPGITLAVSQQLVARQEPSLCLCRSRIGHERNGEAGNPQLNQMSKLEQSPRAGAFVDQVEAVRDARDASIEIVEPTCEADVILVQAKDITAQVNNLTLDPGEPGNDLILLFADLAELAEDPLPLAEDQLQGDLARVGDL
jgi:hypothetical protein